MTVRFQIMRDPRFHLLHQVTQRFSDGPESEEYRLARAGFVLEDTLRKKSEVYPGMLLAAHPRSPTWAISTALYAALFPK